MHIELKYNSIDFLLPISCTLTRCIAPFSISAFFFWFVFYLFKLCLRLEALHGSWYLLADACQMLMRCQATTLDFSLFVPNRQYISQVPRTVGRRHAIQFEYKI